MTYVNSVSKSEANASMYAASSTRRSVTIFKVSVGVALMVAIASVFVVLNYSSGHRPEAISATVTANPDHLFEPIGLVVTSARCVNCHQAAAPKQGDIRRRHDQLVVRGADGGGAATLRCTSCHQASNAADGILPGAKGWGMPAASMTWEGLTAAEICRVMTDPTRNGNRKTPHEAVAHMLVDPLVLWAWNPGVDRTPPPVSAARFNAALAAWEAAGTPCPN